MSVSGRNNVIAFDTRISDLMERERENEVLPPFGGQKGDVYLTDDVFVGHSNDQSIFRCVVLVLVLMDQCTTSVEVGLAL